MTDLNASLKNIVDGLKETLKLGPRNIIGVDIGLSSVKVAEMRLSGSDKYKLVKWARVPLPEGSIIEDEFQKVEEVKKAIENAYKLADISSGNACVGIAGPNTMVRKLQLAGGTIEEIEDQVMWESEQYLPFNIDDSEVSFHVLGENEGGGIDVIVAAATHNVIDNHKEIAESKTIPVKIVDLNQIALMNMFELVMKQELEDVTSSWMFLDFGAQRTHFMIIRHGTIAFSKEINIAGVIITEEIQRQMGVNYNDAEDLKIIGDDQGNLPEEIVEIINDVLQAFFAEIKKTLDFYVTATSDDSLVGCYVTGAGSQTPGLTDGLENLLGVEVKSFNPFDKIEYDKKFDEDTLNDIALSGVVALGLAMRQIDS